MLETGSYWNLKTQLWQPLLALLVCLAAFAIFDIDRSLQSLLYQSGTGFPFQHNELYELWLHDRIKTASNSLLILVLIAIFWPGEKLGWRNYRIPLIVAVLAMISSASFVRWLKEVTDIYCPVQLSVYGGEYTPEPLVNLWHLVLRETGQGQCWPAGHSSTGFAWVGMYFAFQELGRRRAARIMLITALGYGNFLGLVQVVRGEHFLSHQVFTMAFCWYICLGFFAVLHLVDRYSSKNSIDDVKYFSAQGQ